MLRKITFANVGLAGLALATTLATACVADRPSRNGVFDENQYLRKDFLIAPGTGGVDEGWFVKSTIIATSTPNVLANVGGAGLFAGAEGQMANLVRFVINQDQMSIADLRELDNDPTYNSQQWRTSEAINAWPITNVDIKYRIDLDGEKTNFYEENQELDWQLRQWVKINFAKNNLSDLFQYSDENNGTLQNCVDLINTSVELHNNSFNVDEANGYFEFALDLTIPIHIPTPDPGAAPGTVSVADTCIAACSARELRADVPGDGTHQRELDRQVRVRPAEQDDHRHLRADAPRREGPDQPQVRRHQDQHPVPRPEHGPARRRLVRRSPRPEQAHRLLLLRRACRTRTSSSSSARAVCRIRRTTTRSSRAAPRRACSS